ncbi:MAG: hypothetical protein GY707_15750 [Desulfobacteraceae bacterium]|nr:hypothetical protein [Desulfobacteraceae bacterium]
MKCDIDFKEDETILEAIMKVFFKLALIFMIFYCIFLYIIRGMWYPGITPKGISRILINDYKFGQRAIVTGKAYGGFMLQPLKEASEDFTKINSLNSYKVSEVLCSIYTKEAKELFRNLADRKESDAKFVGLLCLSRRNKEAVTPSDITFLIETIKKYINHQRGKPKPGSTKMQEWRSNAYEIERKTMFSIMALQEFENAPILSLLHDLQTLNLSSPLRKRVNKALILFQNRK